MQVDRDYQPTVAQLLGETAAVTALIAAQLKQPGRLTLQLRGNGPIQLLVMDCNEQLQMRGMARSNPVVLPAPVPELLGAHQGGQLMMSLDLPDRPPALPELRAAGRRQHCGDFRALPGAVRTTALAPVR
jgi:molecular chaperone Hsp33